MSRMWGSCLDHVVEVEVVTADGTIRRANANQNQDLFFVSPLPRPGAPWRCPGSTTVGGHT